MAFVKEKIFDGNKELYESFNLYYDGKKREANKFTSWQVDREREIYFISLGGGALERPNIYALIWKGEKVIIDVEIRSTRWLIGCIKASKKLENRKDELIKIIKEVVPISFGCEVIFEVFPDPIFLEDERLNG